jgi:cobalamin biosynthetic protein CobC
MRAARDHGGDLGAAIARFGGAAAEWIDLSTGINRLPYPLPPPSGRALRALPSAEEGAACAAAARRAYGTDAACLPLAGAQAAIRLVPGLRQPGRAAVLAPTYNEHAAAFAAGGWSVVEVGEPEELAGFEAVVVVNPNNPDGRRLAPEALLALAGRVGLLVVDESFADVDPALSVCPRLGRPGLVVLRSFGKFYGLAGLRLGFALGEASEIGRLAEAAGPWAVSGPALEAGRLALADAAWADATRRRLAVDAARLDRLAGAAGWRLVGGTGLFRLYDAHDARAARDRLAEARIWSRAFPWSDAWIRLGLPGPEGEWRRLEAALSAAGAGRRP